MEDPRLVTLKTLNGGAVMELFEEEFSKVMKNIADDNTPAEKIRSINIKISIKPQADRSMASTKVEVSSKIAALKPHESMVEFSFDGRTVEAYVLGALKQPELDGMSQVIPFEQKTSGGR